MMMMILPLALILLPAYAIDINVVPLNNEANAFFYRLLQVDDGLSTPPNSAPAPSISSPLVSPLTQIPTVPARPVGPISVGGMSKSKNGGIASGGMAAGGMAAGGMAADGMTAGGVAAGGMASDSMTAGGMAAGGMAAGGMAAGGMASGGMAAGGMAAGGMPSGGMSSVDTGPIPATNSSSAPGLNSTNSSSVPGMNSTNSSSAPGLNRTNSSFVPICKRDASGSYLEYNDPRYDSPDTEIVASEMTTFESTDTALSIAMSSVEAVGAVAGTLTDVADLSARLVNSFVAIAGVAGVLSLGLNLLGPLFGIGGESADDVIINILTDGFRMVNARLTDIQDQIREGFLEVQAFIGDVALDELTADLDSTMRQYNTYVNATNETRVYYDASLRAYCNAPFHSPQDVFYNIYGYACSNCTFAPRKRADIQQVVLMLEPTSRAQFRQRFSTVVLLSMFNAMYLHSVCLPPVEGLCVDRSTDVTWQDGVTRMNAAFNETVAYIAVIEEQLGNWANLLQSEQLRPLISPGNNLMSAMAIVQELNRTQPDFDVQVLVRDADVQNLDEFIWRKGCNKRDQTCSTTRTDTGHFWLEVVNDKPKIVSIRYRLKSLPLPPSQISISNESFEDFYNRLITRVNRVNTLELRQPSGQPCVVPTASVPTVVSPIPGGGDFIMVARSFPACLVPTCFFCNATEQSAFDMVLASQAYYISLLFGSAPPANEAEFNTNETVFRKLTVSFPELLDGPDNFFFYYN